MTDWLMVIITAVYVIATIAICYYNGKSAKAAKEQLEESKLQAAEQKKQYEETTKQYQKTEQMRIMPFFVISSIESAERKGQKTFQVNVVNCGNGAAVDVLIADEATDIHYMVCKCNANYFLSSPFEKTYQQIGKENCFEIIRDDKTYPNQFADRVSLTLVFCDMLGTKYKQQIFFEYMDSTLGRIGQLTPERFKDE